MTPPEPKYAARLRVPPRRPHEEPERLERNRVALQAWKAMYRAVTAGTVQVQFSQCHISDTTPGSVTPADLATADPLDVEIAFVVEADEDSYRTLRFNLRDAVLCDRGGLCFDWRPIAAALEHLAFEMRRVSVTDDGPPDEDDPNDHDDPDDDEEDAA